MSGPPRVSAHIREEVQKLQRLGWRYARHDSKSHPVYQHPQYGEVTLPNTPSRAGGWKHHLWRTVAQRMSLSVPELEAQMAGQKTVGKRTVRRKPPGRKRPRPLQLVTPEALPVIEPESEPEPVVAYAPTDPITEARKDLWDALQSENERLRITNRYPWRRAA